MNYNQELMELARWRLAQDAEAEKRAFMPPGGDPAAGGAPPGDPSVGGPGGPPPMDPSMGGGMPPGGAPPMDPSMGGGMPPPAPVPGGGGLTPESIAQIVTQTMQQQGGGMGGAPGAAGAGKMVKPDIATVAIDIFQVKKMLQYLFNTMGIQLPPDILDGPNRNPGDGTPMPPGAPGSTSDPTMASQPPPQAGGGQGGAQPGIQPIQPMGGPTPGADVKTADDKSLYMGEQSYEPSFDARIISKAAALASICRKIKVK